MQEMSCAVVGGGIVGLLTALELKQRGIKVSLLEAKDSLGGILRDKIVNDQSYFSSCQYLDALSSWLDLVPIENLYKFQHKYGSYTEIFGHKTTSQNFAGPVCEEYIDIDKIPKAEFCNSLMSVEDRLSVYPAFIKKSLLRWLELIGVNCQKTYYEGLTGLQLSRVYFPNQTNEIINLRQANPLMSDFYGLPREIIGLPEIHSRLPFDGFSDWFDNKLIHALDKITVNVRSPVKPILENSNLVLQFLNGEKVFPERVIWTADPTPIATLYTGCKLGSMPLNAQIIVGDSSIKLHFPFYIQVYSMQTTILRIFLYQIKGSTKFTIEKIKGEESVVLTVNKAKAILEKFDLSGDLTPKAKFNQSRHFLYSINDHQKLFELFDKSKESNLICSGWHLYGRNEKFDFVKSQLS